MKVLDKIKFKVDDTHTLNVIECGDKNGIPVIFLHGGPGGWVDENSMEFFTDKYHLILFDQRGTGESTPFLETKDNDPFKTVEDVEKLRKHFGFEKMVVFGGSYGSTLSLLYAIHYPERVLALVLRGVFLGRNEDIKWLYQEGASYFFPDKFESFKNLLPEEKRDDIVAGYYEIFMSDDEDLKKKAAVEWSNWESGIVNLYPKEQDDNYNKEKMSLSFFECYYFYHKNFFKEDNYILNNVDKIKDIKTYIVHGRYDVDCRPIGAYLLCEKLNDCELYFSDASGHSSFEPNNLSKLKQILENLSI